MFECFRPDWCAGAQTLLPEVLVPIKLELDIPNYTPAAPVPLPEKVKRLGVDPNHPLYRSPDPTGPYRYRDSILWNLHEAFLTPEQFALMTVRDLDFPNPNTFATQLATQIRQQLEEAAPVVLHPLFNAENNKVREDENGTNQADQLQPDGGPVSSSQSFSTPGVNTPTGDTDTMDVEMTGTTGDASAVQDITTDSNNNNRPTQKQQQQNTNGHQNSSSPTSSPSKNQQSPTGITGPLGIPLPPLSLFADDPSDTYKTVINLSLTINGRVFSDRVEWNLLHRPGAAESFAKKTCADMGLGSEWEGVITYAINEQVHRQKKELLESGGGGILLGPEIDNMAVNTAGVHSPGGVRYDPENLCDEWVPRLEELTKEEMERREIDRERQARRQRRETTRVTGAGFTTVLGGMGVGTPVRGVGGGGDEGFVSTPVANNVPGGIIEGDTPALGRGERNKKKKRRFKSLSPVERANTNAAGIAASLANFPDGGMYGYGGPSWGNLNDQYVLSCPECEGCSS